VLRQHEERSAEVLGTLQGNVTVRNLINIHSSGSVSGNVHYGKLAIGNVPPSIGGDLDLTVEKGRAISITLQDLTALDPDDEAKDLGPFPDFTGKERFAYANS
jgi:Polymer-forming cytoskeletal